MAIDTIHAHPAFARRASVRALLLRLWRACHAWHVKRRTRYSLLEMTDDQLQDIGISRSEARREIGKSFYWDMNA